MDGKTRKKPGPKLKLADRLPLEPDRLYTRHESAAVIGCAWITIVRANQKGYLKGFRVGRNLRHTGRQLMDWLESGGHTGHTAAREAAKEMQ